MKTPLADMIGIRDVATLLDASPSTVRRRWHDGTIPAPVRIGPRLLRWRSADLVQFVASAKPVELIVKPEAK